MSSARPRLALLVLLQLLGACDQAGDAPSDAGPDAPRAPDAAGWDAAAGCDESTIYGRYRVYHASEQLYFDGGHGDGPSLLLIEEQERVGACAYHGPPAPFCDPPCEGGSYCDADGTCRAYPTRVSAGAVRIEANGQSVAVAEEFLSYAALLPAGFADPGDRLRLTVGGAGQVRPFDLETLLVPPLDLPSTSLSAREHEDMVIPWPAATSPPGTRAMLHFDNDHHGTASFIQCEVDDAEGAITIPATLLDRLILDGETGIGTYIENAWIARRLAATVDSGLGCAELASESMTWVSVETIRAP